MFTNPAFIVTAARLTANERFIETSYTESTSDAPLSTRISAKAFEHYLRCMHQDVPSLVEWILTAAKDELHTRLAAYMECLMWDAHDSSYEELEAA